MRKIALFSVLTAMMALNIAARADEAVRAAQEMLKTEGYYAGAATGELDADTKAALRRYQIRNQLEPTGALTPETVAALNKGGEAEPTTVPAPPIPAAPIATPPPSSPPPPPPAGAERLPEEFGAAYASLYARTPYSKAPMEVQRETLRKAQAQLSQRGFYTGPVNGFPGPEVEEALLRLQSARGLPRTGTLDIDTLAELHLLPVSKRPIRPQGRPNGAVRGVPLD